jgi:5'-nucleotidase (lipoprotein e(P4) family)
MKKIIFFLSAFICIHAATAQTPDVLPTGPLWGAVYQQRAAEYEALCFQAYNMARWRLDALLAQARSKPPVIITDIDETLLDNSPYAVHQALAGKTYDDSSWIAWTARVACDTVPGALNFLKYAASRGVTIVYITNRLEAERAPTLANLNRWGFPGADDRHLILKQRGATSSKETRRQAVEDTAQVLLFLGDNLSDFSALFDHQSYADRKVRAAESAALFGSTFIVLPNPVYGDWEGALYNNKYPPTLQERTRVLLDSLKTY